jgi:hypothetical protein
MRDKYFAGSTSNCSLSSQPTTVVSPRNRRTRTVRHCRRSPARSAAGSLAAPGGPDAGIKTNRKESNIEISSGGHHARSWIDGRRVVWSSAIYCAVAIDESDPYF